MIVWVCAIAIFIALCLEPILTHLILFEHWQCSRSFCDVILLRMSMRWPRNSLSFISISLWRNWFHYTLFHLKSQNLMTASSEGCFNYFFNFSSKNWVLILDLSEIGVDPGDTVVKITHAPLACMERTERQCWQL